MPQSGGRDLTVNELGKFIDGVIGELEKPQAKGVLDSWVDHLAGDLGEGFLKSRSPDGKPWKPIQPRGEGHNPGHRPLIDTGMLMQSVVSNGKGHIEVVTNDTAIFGTSIEYAGVHQYGRKDGSIVARPFIGIPQSSLIVAMEKIADHLMTRIDAI